MFGLNEEDKKRLMDALAQKAATSQGRAASPIPQASAAQAPQMPNPMTGVMQMLQGQGGQRAPLPTGGGMQQMLQMLQGGMR